MGNPDRLLTSRDLGELLKMHPETIRKWAREGRIPSVILPNGRIRFRREDVEQLLRAGAA